MKEGFGDRRRGAAARRAEEGGDALGYGEFIEGVTLDRTDHELRILDPTDGAYGRGSGRVSRVKRVGSMVSAGSDASMGPICHESCGDGCIFFFFF